MYVLQDRIKRRMMFKYLQIINCEKIHVYIWLSEMIFGRKQMKYLLLDFLN